jgi:hypothetical protein
MLKAVPATAGARGQSECNAPGCGSSCFGREASNSALSWTGDPPMYSVMTTSDGEPREALGGPASQRTASYVLLVIGVLFLAFAVVAAVRSSDESWVPILTCSAIAAAALFFAHRLAALRRGTLLAPSLLRGQRVIAHCAGSQGDDWLGSTGGCRRHGRRCPRDRRTCDRPPSRSRRWLPTRPVAPTTAIFVGACVVSSAGYPAGS